MSKIPPELFDALGKGVEPLEVEPVKSFLDDVHGSVQRSAEDERAAGVDKDARPAKL